MGEHARLEDMKFEETAGLLVVVLINWMRKLATPQIGNTTTLTSRKYEVGLCCEWMKPPDIFVFSNMGPRDHAYPNSEPKWFGSCNSGVLEDTVTMIVFDIQLSAVFDSLLSLIVSWSVFFDILMSAVINSQLVSSL